MTADSAPGTPAAPRPPTRVIKIGGRAQGDAALPGAIAGAVRAGARVVVVHGGGDEVSQLQRQMGLEPTFHNGRRVTTEGDLMLVRMVLSGTVNKRLVGALTVAGVRAAGISGEDGALLTCRVFGDGILGAVGEPESVDPTLLLVLLDAGFTPVVSPLGRFGDGSGCNVNGDDAAAAIAAALRADELLLVADVAGVLDAAGNCIPRLDGDGMAAMIASGAARGGMVAKLESARLTLQRGVSRVRIGALAAIAHPDAGTALLLHPERRSA